jgi:hypothetical protein
MLDMGPEYPFLPFVEPIYYNRENYEEKKPFQCRDVHEFVYP